MKIKDFLLEQLESNPAFFAAYWQEQALLESQEPNLPPLEEQDNETYLQVRGE